MEIAKKLAQDRSDELRKNCSTLSKRFGDLNDEQRLWVDRMLLDHPLLDKAWKVKNAGLAIIPVKSRTKKSKMPALEDVIATVTANDAEAVGQKLDDWVRSINKKLRPFYSKAISFWPTPGTLG